jgi:hypothetical protein
MTIRAITTGILCTAAVLVAPSADASPYHRPDQGADLTAAGLQTTVAQLLDEGRHATSIAERTVSDRPRHRRHRREVLA